MPEFPIGANGFQRRSADGREPFLFSLAPHPHQLAGPVHVLRAKLAQLAHAQAARVNHLQNGGVAKIGARLRLLFRFRLALQFLAGRPQQVLQLLDSQEARQPFFPGGKGELADGRNGGGAVADEKFVKGAQGGEAQLHGGAAQLAAAEEAEKIPEIIPAQGVPIRRRLALAAGTSRRTPAAPAGNSFPYRPRPLFPSADAAGISKSTHPSSALPAHSFPPLRPG